MLTFTGAQLLRAWVALDFFAVLAEYGPRVHPAFFILSGLVWGSLGLWLARGLWRGKAWAPKAAKWGLLSFAAFDWADRLALQAPGPQSVNRPFALLVTGILILIVFGILALPKAQAFYGEQDERPPKNRRTR
ncbi:MAG: hypothetical protein WEA61_09600 [Anaerolineales bacterium]